MNKIIVDDIEKIAFKVAKVMRYDTPSDWNDKGEVTVLQSFSQLDKLALATHEYIEMILLHLQGVTDADVTAWDTEDTRGEYNPSMYEKDPRYKAAHDFAEIVEHRVIDAAGGDWDEYVNRVMEKDIPWARKKFRKHTDDHETILVDEKSYCTICDAAQLPKKLT